MARILHVGKFFPPYAGGIENFLADLMLAQTEQGDIIAAIVHDHKPQLARFFKPVQFEQWNKQTIYRVPSYGRLLYAPVSPQFPFWLNQVIREFQPQLLHLHLPNTSAFFALVLARAKKIPWIIHWHSDVVSSLNTKLSIAYHAYRPYEQRLLAHAHSIIATSSPYLASSTALESWQTKSKVVPLGISETRLPEPTITARNWAEQQWPQHRTRILTVGRLTYYKGHEVLIRAVAALEEVQLFIVGQGELRYRLEKLINELNLTHKVKMLGYCADAELTALFATCDCFCLPSLERTEAFGVVLLEAMRYSKSIVAANIPGSGVAWVIKDAGLLVPPQNYSELAKALQRMIDNPQQRIKLGKLSQQRFKQIFAIKPVAREIAEIYAEVLNDEKLCQKQKIT